MPNRFELFVALRYLTAKRKQAVISVITGISVLGVASGVAALVIALAINTGFRNTLQRNLLGAVGHVTVLEAVTQEGIVNWREIIQKMKPVKHVTDVAPSLYGTVIFYANQPVGGVLKGILPPGEAKPPEVLKNLKKGGFEDWKADANGRMPLILGSRLAAQLGATVGSPVRVVTPQMTAMGQRLDEFPFRVTGVFESGFYEVDNSFAFTSLQASQTALGLADVVNAVEMQIDDVFEAVSVSAEATKLLPPKLTVTNWREQNKPLLTALQGEKAAMVVIIGLIQGVAALNILTSLIMMVMEKHRDIALLMSFGASHQQVRLIFLLQGVLIGFAGTALGLAGGWLACYLGNKFEVIKLNDAIYSLSYVPFEPHLADGLGVAAGAMLVSLIATLYPSRSASGIAPAEALRYE
ncbi:MAG: FtsX-like permease family protein [Acidobacteria bacterium]|nr:FtsX-like permease family protein [Acidobacteriota bacterium]